MVETEDGKERKMTVQIADVRKPLASVAKICDQGNEVVFRKEGGEIVNKKTGATTQMKREGDLYYLYLWVNHEKTKKMKDGFQGQGKR